ncbi:MAG: MFS transporter, partial [Planctomycetota bacterium]|nr:MFS transporter [Planctomycetota bacterium]
GWRIPFLLSVVLLVLSVYIRLKLRESPMFLAMKASGKGSRTPIRDSFCRWDNAQIVLRVLFGATAGQGVVWYAGQFYALYFLTTTCKVHYTDAYWLIAIALVLGTPCFVLCGWLSDRIGRKKLILSGFLLAATTYFPIFRGLTEAANPTLARTMRDQPVTMHTGEKQNGVELVFAAVADAASRIVMPPKVAKSELELARSHLNRRSVPFTLAPGRPGAPLVLDIGGTDVASGYDAAKFDAVLDAAGYDTITVLLPDGTTRAADPAAIDRLRIVLLLTLLVIYVTMVYGPIAAYLVELFPTRIRYTSMSLPYHIGNGWFGGFLPLIAASIVVFTGDIYAGLWYPIGIALLSLVTGLLLLDEQHERELDH